MSSGRGTGTDPGRHGRAGPQERRGRERAAGRRPLEALIRQCSLDAELRRWQKATV